MGRRKKTDEELLKEILERSYRRGCEFGKHYAWRRGTIDGKPVLVDYDKQQVWIEAIPLMESKGLILDADEFHDRP